VEEFRAVFFGSKQFGLDLLEHLVVTLPLGEWLIIHPNDSSDSRSIADDFENFARNHGMEYYFGNDDDKVFQSIKKFSPSIGLACGWYRILDRRYLEAFSLGIWGIHNSLLPKFRGGSPLVWSIIEDQNVIGSTLFRITDRMDSGHIALQVEVKNRSTANISDFLREIQGKMIEKLPSVWMSIIRREAKLKKQNERHATYSSMRIEADGRIDWDRDSYEIHNFIRAQCYPYPGAFTFLGGEKVQISESNYSKSIVSGTPGQILRIDKKNQIVLISCGSDTVIEIVQARVGNSFYAANLIFSSINMRLS
jgi:methionyl-tRNA formyltransferase